MVDGGGRGRRVEDDGGAGGVGGEEGRVRRDVERALGSVGRRLGPVLLLLLLLLLEEHGPRPAGVEDESCYGVGGEEVLRDAVRARRW